MFDDERRREIGDDCERDEQNDNATIHVEEMTDDERRIRRVANVRKCGDIALDAGNVVREIRRILVAGGLPVPGLATMAIERIDALGKKLDRVLELDGE